MILHIYLITVCTYFEPGRPWADIIQEINKKSKNSNFLLFTKWLPALDWFTAWITLGIGLCGHFRIKVWKCPEPLPRAGNSTSNWAVQNALQSRVEFLHLIVLCIRVLCKSHKQQCINSLDKYSTQLHCMLWSSYWQSRQTRYHTQYTIALLWSFVLTISTCPLMYTQEISEWLPHYLIQSRSHCNSNFKSKRVLIRRNNPK